MPKEKRTLRGIRIALIECGVKSYFTSASDLENLLAFQTPVAYTAGDYGWNFDEYDFGRISIFCGYRYMPGEKIPHELCEEYNNRASEILHSEIHYENMEKQMKCLLEEFLNKLSEL